MPIAQLTHLHFCNLWAGPSGMLPGCSTLPWSAVSRRVLFARDVTVIESLPLMFYPVEEPESLTVPTVVDTETLERSDIQIAWVSLAPWCITGASQMVPPAPPGPIMTCWDYHWQFLQLIVCLQGIQWNTFLHLLWWRRTIRMGMHDCWHRYVVLRHLSRCCGRQCRRNSPTVLSTVWPDLLRPGLRTLFLVGVWLGRAHFCRSVLTRASGALAVDVPSAVLHTGLQTLLNPPGSMGCRCTTFGFWNGTALRSWLAYWIQVLVLGCTCCPVSRPLTLPANFTGKCVSLLSNFLDQYVLCLKGTATKSLELTLGAPDFPSVAVDVGAMVPLVHWASVYMEAMGLWHPLLDPVRCPWTSSGLLVVDLFLVWLYVAGLIEAGCFPTSGFGVGNV